MKQTASRPAAADLIHGGQKAFFLGLLYAGVLSGVINLLQLTVPLFMLQVHDRVVNSQSLDTLVMLIIIAAVALVLFGVLDFVRALTFQVMGSALLRKLNLPVLQAAVSASLGRSGARASQAIRDLNDIRSFITGSAIGVPLEAIWCPIFLAVLFALHPIYGLVALVSATILVVLSLVSDLLTRRTLKRANEAAVDSLSEISASLRHAEAIEAMGMLPALARRWRAAQMRTLDLLDMGTRRGRAIASITRSCRYMMQIAALSAGAMLVIEQEVSPGSMVAASIIMGRLLLPFDTMVDGWRQWVFALAAWRRVRDLLENQTPARETKPTPRTEGELIVDRLVFAPPGSDIPVLKGVSFALSPGEVLGIVGPSAAGKSTLARLMVGVLKPTAGGIYLDGHSVYLWERGSFGDMVGYLPQSVSLLDGTIRENIARMREADPRLVLEAARLAGVHEMIGRLPLGYDTQLGEAGQVLSGGQRQRIGLARALYGNPRLIVLDEPNANLDAEGEQALMRAIDSARAGGAMVALIAHRPSIMQIADKLLVLQDGRVSQFGPRTAVVGTIDPGERPAAVAGGGRVAVLAREGRGK
ncbi:type I secretion system permease/ATPase [Chelatococcus sp. SYSU_G07232]|uniref:Type I secretion system permease/ATPase n=1 Tax=Chelatococcus albus TaxID=3047466 RepID=A0ABT7AKT6_9HYPH|nr:type I secretion system permease/ATPase [Chelatococcus sp. SYSU_G07232]MDJ1159988.1 type I secretion system permease/ATPase [Chelatococcus sp. SYSU_G07232]